MQALHLDPQQPAALAVEPVGDQQRHRALAEDPARPANIELGQARADAGSPRPVVGGLADALQRDVDVAVAQVAGDVCQACAEDERGDPIPVVGDRMQEVQQHA